MKVGVLLKQVPATDSRITISDASVGVDTAELKWEINPYDEFALEQALLMKDSGAASEVVILTLGGSSAEVKIREALARGADRAVRMDDSAFEGSDSLGVSRVLAAAVKSEGLELVFAGKQSVDNDNSQVPAMVAELLGWPQMTVVTKLELEGDTMKGWRVAGGGSRAIVEAKLPLVVSCDKGLNEPRYASLRGIMMAKRKKIAVIDAAGLGLDASTVGASAAFVSRVNWTLPPPRPAGRILEGDAQSVVEELVQLLRDEAKVI